MVSNEFIRFGPVRELPVRAKEIGDGLRELERELMSSSVAQFSFIPDYDRWKETLGFTSALGPYGNNELVTPMLRRSIVYRQGDDIYMIPQKTGLNIGIMDVGLFGVNAILFHPLLALFWGAGLMMGKMSNSGQYFDFSKRVLRPFSRISDELDTRARQTVWHIGRCEMLKD